MIDKAALLKSRKHYFWYKFYLYKAIVMSGTVPSSVYILACTVADSIYHT